MRPLLLLIAIVSLTACHVDAQHTGKRPMGPRRAPNYEDATTLEERLQAREQAPNSTGVAVDAADQVIGAHTTRVYHLSSCDELESVTRAERILFVSGYDALDGGYKPCPRCRPGP